MTKSSAKKAKQRTTLYINSEVMANVEKAADKLQCSKTDYINTVLYEHFNQDVHTLEAIFSDIAQLKHTANRQGMLHKMTLELLVMFFESYLSRAPKIPSEYKNEKRLEVQNLMTTIIEAAARRVKSDKAVPIPDADASQEELAEAMKMMENSDD
jgi:hypothetical protein